MTMMREEEEEEKKDDHIDPERYFFNWTHSGELAQWQEKKKKKNEKTKYD